LQEHAQGSRDFKAEIKSYSHAGAVVDQQEVGVFVPG
jgi:hypothetical protein